MHRKESLTSVLLITMVMCLFAMIFKASSGSAYAADLGVQGFDKNSNVKFLEQSTFVDSMGRTNVIGTVRNIGAVPEQVSLGVNVTEDAAHRFATIENYTYGRIVWPSTDSPFKLTLSPGQHVASPAFVLKATSVNKISFNTLSLNYTNMAVGQSRSLVGTVKNDGPFDIYGLSIFASVHDGNMTQLDSVRSDVIPVLRVGEQKSFSVSPDPAIRSKAYYYSCAGTDSDSPIPTLDLGGGRFLPFDLEAVAKVANLGYDNKTNSIVFDVTHYNPNGGPLSLKIPQISANQSVEVLMDSQAAGNTSVKSDGRTISIDMFIPKGEHHVQIENVTAVPEFPLVLPLAAAIFSVAVVASRFGFKISEKI